MITRLFEFADGRPRQSCKVSVVVHKSACWRFFKTQCTHSLEVGANSFIIIVIAADGSATRTYTVTVVRAAPAASNDATLKSITVSSGALSPAFTSGIMEYTVNVENSVTGITITCESNHAKATVASNVTEKTLNVGENTVIITVTAEDGETKKTYTVTVIRAEATTDVEDSFLLDAS